MPARLSILLFALCSVAAHAAAGDDVWMSVLLDGRKIGSMHTTRRVNGDHVVTAQEMSIEIERAGMKVQLSTGETDEETRAGKPLRFESRSKISGLQSIQTGIVHDDGRVDVTSQVAGVPQSRTIQWPKGAVLAEGMRLQEQKAGLIAGMRYSASAFQVENLEAVAVDSLIGPRQWIDLPEGKRSLVKIEQTIALGGAPTRTTSWVDNEQTVHKLRLPMMGYELTMLACSKACAMAPNQSTDILVHSLVQSPRAISSDERRLGVRLRVSANDGSAEPLQFATTDEQSIDATSGATTLRIAPLGEVTQSVEAKPLASDTQANDWLQSDAPEIIALAKRGVGDATAPRVQMQHLEDFVRAFITNKDLSVGYASALEVARNPEGDCTEHAVLLAALGRARGIPTRVVDGLVYVDHYTGGEHVFVPHAWAQAYVDGAWRSFDAALHGFDAGHIALSIGDGDPWRFYAGFNTLGHLRIDSVDASH